jgi:hypothetical protein
VTPVLFFGRRVTACRLTSRQPRPFRWLLSPMPRNFRPCARSVREPHSSQGTPIAWNGLLLHGSMLPQNDR